MVTVRDFVSTVCSLLLGIFRGLVVRINGSLNRVRREVRLKANNSDEVRTNTMTSVKVELAIDDCEIH